MRGFVRAPACCAACSAWRTERPSRTIRFGYRVILHKGDTASAKLPAAYEAYARPPVVEIIP